MVTHTLIMRTRTRIMDTDMEFTAIRIIIDGDMSTTNRVDMNTMLNMDMGTTNG